MFLKRVSFLCLTAHNVWGPSSQDLVPSSSPPPSKPQKREEGAKVKMKYILLVVLTRLRNLEFRTELHLERLGWGMKGRKGFHFCAESFWDFENVF